MCPELLLQGFRIFVRADYTILFRITEEFSPKALTGHATAHNLLKILKQNHEYDEMCDKIKGNELHVGKNLSYAKRTDKLII